jgi:hypothetical protein
MMFADDTVIYYSNKSTESIEAVLNTEFGNLAKYFTENDLIVNLKKGKTEYMLLGTGKRLSKTQKVLNLKCGFTEINKTDTYKYLGSVIDQTLSMSENFNSTYKKASSRLRLLKVLNSNLDNVTSSRIYHTFIVPLLLFNSLLNLNYSKSQQDRLHSLDRRAKSVTKNKSLTPIQALIKRHACSTVRKILDGETCSNFIGYFEINQHSKRTRNSTNLLKVPKIKLEVARGSFYFMGTKLYNELPLNIRKVTIFNEFQKNIRSYLF